MLVTTLIKRLPNLLRHCTCRYQYPGFEGFVACYRLGNLSAQFAFVNARCVAILFAFQAKTPPLLSSRTGISAMLKTRTGDCYRYVKKATYQSRYKFLKLGRIRLVLEFILENV